MVGSAIKMAGAVTASPWGKLHTYEGMYDSTVYLWDAGYAPMTSVPAHSATVTNLVRDQAAAISGLTAAQCDFAVINQTGSFLGTELTSKKGIHAASTQAGSQNAGACFEMNASAAFADWLLTQTDAGADYGLLLTAWALPTRAQISSATLQPFQMFAAQSGTASNYHNFAIPGFNYAGSAVLAGNGVPMAATTGTPQVEAIISKGWAGTKPSAGASILTAWNIGAAWAMTSANYNKASSGILYRTQIDLVDLSEASGATVAAKASAMIAEHQAMLARDFAVGGRFHGDTYTAAAALKA